MGVSFDCFGTLVTAATPDDPAAAVASELGERSVRVPDEWESLYASPQIDAPEGAEVPLPAHVNAVLRAAGVEARGNVVRRAVIAAFDPTVETRPGATEAIEAARESGPVALCSNCSVPELVSRTLIRSELDRDAFDAIVTSAGCGWRKPDPRIFETVARTLDVAPETLVHVGDDPATDRGVEAVGGAAIVDEELRLADVTSRLREMRVTGGVRGGGPARDGSEGRSP